MAGIDHLDEPLPTLGEIACRMQGRAEEAEKRYERLDFASCALERHLSLELARGNRLISTGEVLDMLGAIGQFGACGLRGRVADDLLRDFETEIGRGA